MIIFFMYRLRPLITWQLIKVLAGNYDELEFEGGGCMWHTGEKRNSHRILVGKPEEARPTLKTEAWMKEYL